MNNAYDKFGRPCKDLYFMNLAFEVSWRSIDPRTKHGCVVVDEYGSIIATGYNGPLKNSNDDLIPLNEQKYYFIEHSERNAIISAAATGRSLEKSTFYITGLPCIDCLRAIIGSQAKKVIYGPAKFSFLSDKEYVNIYHRLVNNQKIIIERFKYDKELLEKNQMAFKACQSHKEIPEINLEFNV